MADINPNIVVSMPSQLFTLARSFKAAANGSIYLGQVDTDPLIPANQIQVYVENEDGTYTEVPQPIKLNTGGYPVYAGQVAKFVTVEGQSMTVLDSFGVQQFYFPSVLKYDPDQLRQALMSGGVGQGTDIPIYNRHSARSTNRTATSKLSDIPSILDWASDSATDDSTRFTKALLDGVSSLLIPTVKEYGKAFTVGNVDINRAVKLWGHGSQGIAQTISSIIKAAGSNYAFHFTGVGVADIPTGGGIEGINITGANASDTGSLIKATTWSYLKAIDCGFNGLSGWGIALRDVAESTIEGNIFRRLGSDATGTILLDDYLTTTDKNVNNLHIEGNTFGLNSGAWIKASSNANADMIWVDGNKFEWDGNPISPNSSSKYVLDFQDISRAWVMYNGFTHFTSSNNLYAGLLRMGSGSSLETTFAHNKMFGCTGLAWDVQGGSLSANNNEADRAGEASDINGSITSSRPQNIKGIRRYTSNGNRANPDAPLASPAAYLTCHDMYGTVNNNFVSDADASLQTAITASSGTELRRYILPQAMRDKKVIPHITARIKCSDTGGSDGQISAFIDGVIIAARTVIASDGWQTVRWEIKPTMITNGLVTLTNSGGVSLILDGIYAEKQEYIDWSFAWSPGSIANGAFVAAPVQSFTDTVGNSGVIVGAVATPNAVNAGLIFSTQIDGNGTISIFCHNLSGGAVIPAFTRINLRIFI